MSCYLHDRFHLRDMVHHVYGRRGRLGRDHLCRRGRCGSGDGDDRSDHGHGSFQRSGWEFPDLLCRSSLNSWLDFGPCVGPAVAIVCCECLDNVVRSQVLPEWLAYLFRVAHFFHSSALGGYLPRQLSAERGGPLHHISL